MNITKEDFREFIEKNPEKKKDLESLVTVVLRKRDDLVAKNYSNFFREHLRQAHDKMVTASKMTENKSLRTFLRSRAEAFLSNDYYQSDKDWMDLNSRIEMTIGPYETYADKLLGLKASFEAYVTVKKPVESAKLAKYESYHQEMEQNLPIPEEMKTERGSESTSNHVYILCSL